MLRACVVRQPGNRRPRGLRKVRALPIHLNSHTVGLPNSHPQPLNITFEIPSAALIMFFKRLCFMRIRCPRCDSYQLALAAKCCSCTQSTKSSICLVKGASDQMSKCNSILGDHFIKSVNCCFPSLLQVFLHRLNQYAATKLDKNITEETVKVRVNLWGMGLHN